MISKISIIGTGNIATWFYNTFQSVSIQEFQVQMVSGRDLSNLYTDADLYLFSVKDDVYQEVIEKIPFKMNLAVHTAGSLSHEIFNRVSNHHGVIYPYQTITKNYSSDHSFLVPLCIDGNCSNTISQLLQLGKKISPLVEIIDEDQRKALHLAAVFACNFSNAMFDIGNKILEKNNIDWDFIIPLLEETVNKVKSISPEKAQTGPAKRGDVDLIQTHLESLKGSGFEKIYQEITAYILKKHSNS